MKYDPALHRRRSIRLRGYDYSRQGAYQSCVSTACLKIAKSRQPEVILGKLWQRNFWEHIIRTVEAFDNISHYIISNPENWEADKFYRQE